MKTLDDLDSIAIRHQTDRASFFTRTYGKPHDYARHYERVFGHLRHEPIKLLEIGAAGGEGVKMWLSYFDHLASRVVGVDIVQNTNEWNTPGKSPDPRYKFCQGDQGDGDFWQRLIAEEGGFDICIDDGSHINTDIIVTFIALWPHVKPGGFYAIEDLATAYGGSDYFVKSNLPNHMDWMKGKIDALNTSQGDIDSIYCSRELAIIRKVKA